ncbi:hypothetical protein ACJX0J_026226, partial [Zea mays]
MHYIKALSIIFHQNNFGLYDMEDMINNFQRSLKFSERLLHNIIMCLVDRRHADVYLHGIPHVIKMIGNIDTFESWLNNCYFYAHFPLDKTICNNNTKRARPNDLHPTFIYDTTNDLSGLIHTDYFYMWIYLSNEAQNE